MDLGVLVALAHAAAVALLDRPGAERFLATTSFHQQFSSAEDYQLLMTARRLYLLAPDPAPGCGNHPDFPCPPRPVQVWCTAAPREAPQTH